MAWLNYSGHTASQFPMDIHGGGSISPHLVQPHNQWADIFKTLAPAIKDYMDKRKADQIANEVLNMQNPPRAAAVDQYGATYDPALAKSQGLDSATDPMATAPATGGQQQYKAQALFKAYQDQQDKDKEDSVKQYWQNKVMEAHANQLQANADAPDNRVEITLPDGRKAMVTGNEAAQYMRPRAAQQDSMEKIDKDVIAYTGHHLSDLINSTDARNTPDGGAIITLADGKTKVPVTADALQHIRDRYARLQQFSGAQAFQDRQQQQGELPAPDLPPVTEPAPTLAPALPSTTGKQLDAGTAKAILLEAGGDKDKARQIARERGYSF